MKTTLPDKYSISVVDKADEIELVALLSTDVHAAGEGATTRQLAFNHPVSDSIRWLVAKENKSGEMVSTLCLIPWTIIYDGIVLPAGEMGIVGTRKDHRGLGLASALADRFIAILRSEGYLLTHIQGIAWFYRQFGYEYTLPLETKTMLEFRHVTGTGALPVILRKADERDIEILDAFYCTSIENLDLAASRTREHWSYLLGPSMLTGCAADTYIVESDGNAVGYCRVPREGFGEALILGECSNLPEECFHGFFVRLKEMAQKLKKPFVRLNLGPTHPAVIAARDLGAQDQRSYAWQIRIPDAAPFLQAIVPSLERRLKTSAFASYNGTLEIFLYRESVSLRFEGGRVVEITPGASDNKAKGYSQLRMPPNLFSPLVLGQKSIAECAAFYPDLGATSFTTRLFETLFPPMTGFLHSPY